MPKLPGFLGIRRGLSSGDEPKDEKLDGDGNLNDHVEIDFSASAPSQVNSHQPAATAEPQTENGKKQSQGSVKPQSKVSPFTNMHHKLNFIPHSQRDKLNTRFLATLHGVLKIAELVRF